MKRRLLWMALAACAAGAALAESESGTALLRLLNSRSAGAPKTYAEAAKEVAAEAAEGKLLQGFVLALVSREAGAPEAARIDDATREKYFAAARDKIRVLAEDKGNALAWYLLALDSGDTNLLRRAADGGNAQALNAWGSLCVSEAMNVRHSSNEVVALLSGAVERFRQAAGQGDANGLYNLGMCYGRGLGVARNDEKAFTSFRAAAEKGHPEAINSIGWFFREGRVVTRDDVLATRWFAKSAAYGNAYGQFNYALAFLRGEGVKKDLEEGAKYLKRAAEGGCVEAMNAWAVALGRGEGVKKDARLSVQWLQRAAEEGYPPAMENLSGCYERGEGVDVDEKRALKWKIRSRAAQGDRNAATWLAAHDDEENAGRAK